MKTVPGGRVRVGKDFPSRALPTHPGLVVGLIIITTVTTFDPGRGCLLTHNTLLQRRLSCQFSVLHSQCSVLSARFWLHLPLIHLSLDPSHRHTLIIYYFVLRVRTGAVLCSGDYLFSC